MDARVKSRLRVDMAMRLGNAAGRFGVVVHKGDDDSGGVLVVLHGRDGLRVLSQTRNAEGEIAWMRATGPAPVDQEAADAYVAKQRRYDPDLWVLEFESPDGLPPFSGEIL